MSSSSFCSVGDLRGFTRPGEFGDECEKACCPSCILPERNCSNCVLSRGVAPEQLIPSEDSRHPFTVYPGSSPLCDRDSAEVGSCSSFPEGEPLLLHCYRGSGDCASLRVVAGIFDVLINDLV